MIRRLAHRLTAKVFGPPPAPPAAPPEPSDPNLATLSFRKFHDEPPGGQAAVDLFKGRWASSFPDLDPPLTAGSAPHFTIDHRPRQAAVAFGGPQARLDGFKVLELGPLEGGHTYQLEGFGADVTAVEGNAEAYLKCLIAKEILDMRSKFLLGDFVQHLRAAPPAWDLIFASGVLYHMVRPLELIELICRAGARSFLWTHYYDPERCEGFGGATASHGGVSAEHWRKGYGDQTHGQFWGGLADASCWLSRDDILAAFRAFGHSRAEVIEENLEHPHGPCFTVVTSR